MNEKNNIICIIPARKGSKRIPNKNVIDFMGKPMIYWTIKAAINSKLFSKILVSTDCKKIAKIAEKYGAEVPFLREEAYDDFSSVSEATISTLIQAKNYFNKEFNIVVQLMPNTPLRDSDDIISHVSSFMINNRQFQISAFKFGWMNPWWSAKIEEGTPKWIFPEMLKKRSQDLDDLYCPTGSIWIARQESLLKKGSFYGDNLILEEIDWKSATDIDDLDDLEFAKAVFILKNSKKK